MAGSEIASLFAKIGADYSGLTGGLDRVKDNLSGAAKTMLGAGNLLAGGLKAGLTVAFGAAAAGAGVLAAGLGLAMNEAMEAQTGLAQLDAALKSTGEAAQQQADAWAAAQGKTISVNKMGGEALGELQDKLEGATARLADLQFSWDHAKTKTETAERSLNKAREAVASLQQQIAEGSGTIEVGLAGVMGLVAPVARIARDELLSLADSLQKLTPISDDAVIAAEAQLLTFTRIGKDVFPDTIRAILDMATAMNSGLTPSSGQLVDTAKAIGKALNDPVDGLTRLTKAGVVFSKEQENQIKAMAAAGDAAGAQRVMLDELFTEFGGSSQAQMKTVSGLMQNFRNRILNVAEGIGNSFLPRIQDFLTNGIEPLLPKVETMGEAFTSTFGTILDNGRDPLTALLGGMSAAIYAIADGNPQILAMSAFVQGLGNSVNGLVTSFTAAWPGIIGFITGTLWPILDTLWQGLSGGDSAKIGAAFAGLWGLIQPPLAQLSTEVVAWVQAQLPVWGAQLQAWGNAFVGWVADKWPVLEANLFLLAHSIKSWIELQIPGLIEKLGAWKKEFIEWVTPAIPKVEEKLGELVGKIVAYLIDPGIPTLVEGFKSLVAGVFGIAYDTTPAYAQGKTFADSFLKGFKTGVGDAGKNLWDFVFKPETSDEAAKSENEVKNVFAGLYKSLGLIPSQDYNDAGAGLGRALTQGLTLGMTNGQPDVIFATQTLANQPVQTITESWQARSPAQTFVPLGNSLVQGLMLGIANETGAFTALLTALSVNQYAATRLAFGSQNWAAIGQGLMDGIGKGIRDRMNAVAGQAIEAARAIIVNIKKELDIKSPSRVMAEIGGLAMSGLAQGMNANISLVDASAQRASQHMIDNSVVDDHRQNIWQVQLSALNGYDSLAQMQAQAGAW